MTKLIATVLLILILWFIIIPLTFGIFFFIVKAAVLLFGIYALIELIAIIRNGSSPKRRYRR